MYTSPIGKLPVHRSSQKKLLLNFNNLKLIKEDDTLMLDTRKDNRTRGGAGLMLNFPRFEIFKESLSYLGPKCCNCYQN